MNIYVKEWASPLGTLRIGSYGDAVCLVLWADGKNRESIERIVSERLNAGIMPGKSPAIEAAISELEEYFGGKRRQFNFKILHPGTDFQQLVWNHLRNVPYGCTATYKALAATIGLPKSVRAVATAIARNPLNIVLPCHRIVPSTTYSTAGGYAGGADRKTALLSLEGH